MNENENLLKIVTNETKASIEELEIVSPSMYNSIFLKFARNHKLQIEDEVKLSYDIIEKECTALTNLQSETSKNALILSDSTSRAISAIQDKDENLLNDVLQETQELKKEIEKLKESMYKDMLTKTFNRKWIHENIIDKQTHISTQAGVFAFIDLNHFKLINDTYGHMVGDKVLSFIANEFLNTRYPVVRYGGDEFIIIFPKDVSETAAANILKNVREKVLKKKLKSHEQTFTLSFSYGIKKFQVGELLTTILAEADKNMYEDKIEIKKRITGI